MVYLKFSYFFIATPNFIDDRTVLNVQNTVLKLVSEYE